MIHRYFLPFIWTVVIACATEIAVYAGPVATVTTKALVKGSMPITLRVYGRVAPGTNARQTIMTPLSATIDTVFVHQGTEVAKSAPLVRLVPSPQAAAAYARALTALRVARDLVQRTHEMVKEHLATVRQLSKAQQSQSDAEVTLAALKKQGAGGTRILRAPFAAIVTAVSARTGAIVSAGATLFDLSRLKGLVLTAGAVPEQALVISKGDAARVIPLGSRQSYAGTVILRGNIVDPATGLVPVEIALPAGKFLPGQSAEAVITTGHAQGYIVPHAAILVNEKGANYVVQAVKGAAKMVPVQILAEGDAGNVIGGRLDGSAPVVLTGNYQLEEGMQLRIDPPKNQKAVP